ncbi:hypothetical protein OEZ85_006361 [Tetradesmus obliquus]|uniref:POLO box domain-containing protein n=1 Tax=Tetradesmus obliquus TaxID=3088 RepID=A0ABY8TZ41_TETOB|nr:hypothetical protein OEZ85_006361 [Tetradesmus obliquus]
MSPRAGLQIPGAQGSASAAAAAAAAAAVGVQPCPPPRGQPPAPSPSVTARAAHGCLLPHAVHGWQAQHNAQGGAGVSGGGTHQAVAAAVRRRVSASAADVHFPLQGSSSSSGGGGKQRSCSTLNETRSWDMSCLTALTSARPSLVDVQLDVDSSSCCELQLEASRKSAAGEDAGEGSLCSTPNMDWPADAPSVEALQERAEQQQQQQQQQQHASGSTSVSASTGADGRSEVGLQKPSPAEVHSAAAAAAAPAGAADAADLAAPPAAAAAGQLEGCPDWPSPVVAAFAHYKGRLGYLMSSGVVGVVFEDSSHMFVRSSDGWACYHEHGDSSSAAAGVGPGPVLAF